MQLQHCVSIARSLAACLLPVVLDAAHDIPLPRVSCTCLLSLHGFPVGHCTPECALVFEMVDSYFGTQNMGGLFHIIRA